MTARNPRLSTKVGRYEAKLAIVASLEQSPPEGEFARVLAGLTGIHPLDIGELLAGLRLVGLVRQPEGPGTQWCLVPGAPSPVEVLA